MQQFRIIRSSDSVTLWQGLAQSMRDAVQIAINQKVSLAGALLTGQDLRGLVAREANLYGAMIDSALVDGGDFTLANMGTVYGVSGSLSNCKFVQANLTSANFTSATLDYSDFAGARTTSITVTSASKIGINVDPFNSADLA